MNKLVERFREINSYPTGPDSWIELIDNERCANESKKLAIEFAKSLNGIHFPSWNLEHNYHEAFNNFLEEYYK